MERMPKNIRQIGGREDRIKVYVEDYAGTYLRKLQEEREEQGAAGMLVGEWQKEGETNLVFIGGAVEMNGAETEGGRLRLTEAAWTDVYGSLGTYFSGQDLCGIFVCEGSCRRFRRQALFAAVRESFPDQGEALLFLLTDEGEELFYRITQKGEERLQGYYCYFERNEAMQEYMMDNLQKRQVEKEELPGRRCREEVPYEKPADAGPARGKEGTLGDPSESFRERMRRQQEEKSRQKSGRGIFGLCAAMAVVVFAGGLLLMQKESRGIQVSDILNRLKINASELLAVSAGVKEETTEETVSASAEGVVVEEIPGNVYPTEESSQPESSQPESSQPETTSEPQMSQTADEQTAPAASTDEPSSEAAASTGVTYIVQAGDSLYSISRKFYGTESMVSRIQELNNLTNADLIKEGQTLILP